jgi:hypothetical protein
VEHARLRRLAAAVDLGQPLVEAGKRMAAVAWFGGGARLRREVAGVAGEGETCERLGARLRAAVAAGDAEKGDEEENRPHGCAPSDSSIQAR